MAVTRDSWDVLANVYGVERSAEAIGAVIADWIGVLGPANRIEVVGIVSALVANRVVQSGKSIKNDPIVRWCKEGRGLGVLLVPEERLGTTEPRWDSAFLTDRVIEELKRAFSAAKENRVGDTGAERTGPP